MNSKKFDGKVVVVTGAGGALGGAVCSRLVDGGAKVVAVDHDPGKVQDLGDAMRVVAVDLSDESATLAFAHDVLQEFGQVDGVFHLVGGWRGGKGIVEADLADWDFLHEGLIRTLQHVSRAFHDALVESKGRFAIISSTGVAKPTAKNASYAAGKAAAEAWTQAVAHSFADSGAAATILRVVALLTPAQIEQKPDAKFGSFTHVDDVADALVGLFAQDDVNGEVRTLPRRDGK